MKRVTEKVSDRRHPSQRPERYGLPLEPGDIPMYNFGEDSGATENDW